MKKFQKYVIVLLPVLLLLLYGLLEFTSRSAAYLFNRAMEDQDILRGTVTVESISADIMGNVEFEDLQWVSPEGKPIVRIPRGAFQVSVWDVLTRHLRTTSIQELELQNASASLYLDENMNLDIVPPSPEFHRLAEYARKKVKPPPPKPMTEDELKELGRRKRDKMQREFTENLRNFHHDGKDFKLRLRLDHCGIEVLHENKQYLIGNVSIDADIDTRRTVTLNIRTGPFGGTMIGRGIFMHGKVNMAADPVPDCTMAIMLKDINPASLGLGVNIHDNMTLHTYFKGPVTSPTAEGSVSMKELHLPGLDFYNIDGDIHYEDSKLNFQDVTANVYGGTLTAQGIYDFDTRYYRIEGTGENLLTEKALPKGELNCKVHLDITVESKGSARETYTRGSFTSGPGFYKKWIPFDRLSGRFTNAYQDIRFYDPLIEIGSYKISTDFFSIIDKKLTLHPINLTDADGKLIMYYNPDTKEVIPVSEIR